MHQKSLWPRKNWRWLIAPSMLLFTMLPLGMAATPRGMDSFMAISMFLAASLLTIPILNSCMRCGALTNRISTLPHLAANYIFKSSECRFRAVIFFMPLLASYALAYAINDNLPNVIDAIAQFDHARLLLEQKFSVTGHPLREFFPMDNVIHSEYWYSQYQLGSLLAIALGHAIHWPGIVSPFLCGFSVLLLYAIAKEHYRFEVARIAGVLAAFCPLWWYMASDYMSHNTMLTTLLLYVWANERTLRSGKISYGLLTGIGLGLAVITRPLTAFAFAVPILLYTLVRLLKLSARYWMVMIMAGVVCISFCAWQLYFNQQTTGQWLQFAPEVLFGDQVSYGFGKTITAENFIGYKGYVHQLWNGIGNMSNNLVGLNLFLFNWPLPSLLFVFLMLTFFKPTMFTKLMLACWVSLSLAYIPYFFQDWCYGPRFMHEITGFLIILTAYGIYHFRAVLRVVRPGLAAASMMPNLLMVFGVLYILGALLFYIGLPRELYSCWTNKPQLTRTLDAMIPDHSLVFANTSYKQFLMFMPPRDDSRVIYAKDLKEKNQLLMDYYPDRMVFLETTPLHYEKIRDAIKP